jgi:hypothetical protein
MEALEVMEARSGELAGADASDRGGDGGGGGEDTATASREGTEAEGLPPGCAAWLAPPHVLPLPAARPIQ